ncbi:hypothetical protein B9Z55_011061 [Caenorhabditis nigoni]|uniref:Helitron helicase-like domain-containing protein n=1 Tax=Caenorhabditis nigoni TaxID=1611254 RepID=A0A2G5UIG6_9PELO|nr:hypothetical protein B9Z55_011061 [Caenorhabditis nigoni]
MRYWRHRMNFYFNDVLLAPNGPLGTLTHFFYRVGYQHRGTHNVHCVLWTSDRPDEDFIDARLTARIPNETEEEELHKIVVQNQMHWKKHSKTCQRKVKIRGRFTTTRCRFGFPRPMLRRTFVFGNKNRRYSIPGVTRRTYFIARQASKVND